MRSLFLVVPCLVAAVACAGVVEDVKFLCKDAYTEAIAKYCYAYVDKQLQSTKGEEESLDALLKDDNLRQACHFGQMFAQLKNAKLRVATELKDEEFRNWFFSQPTLARELAFAGTLNQLSLTILNKLWLQEEKALNGTTLNLALGAALATDPLAPSLCEEKYNFYRTSHKGGQLFPQFDSLSPWEMNVLLRAKESVENLTWGQEYLRTKPNVTAENAASAACRLIAYKMTNDRGVSVHSGDEFYDYKAQTLQVYVEYGGVCGAVSTAAKGFLLSKGVPGYTFRQPGHCAFLFKNTKGKWVIGNNIRGWVWSTYGTPMPCPWEGAPFAVAALGNFQEKEHAEESLLCYELAQMTSNKELIPKLLKLAIKKNDLNLPAWRAYFALIMPKLKPDAQLKELAEARRAFDDDSCSLRDLVDRTISIDPNRKEKYKLCAQYLTQQQSVLAIDIYLGKVVPCLLHDIPFLQGKLKYNVDTRRTFFSEWFRLCKKSKIDAGTKRKTINALVEVIQSLEGYDKAKEPFIKHTQALLVLWDEPRLKELAAPALEPAPQKAKELSSPLSV